MLEPAPTLRLAKSYEVPDWPKVQARVSQGWSANIVAGFTLSQNETHSLPFAFYAEINVDNSRFWELFLALSTTLPPIVSCLYGGHEQEPTFSDYVPKEEIMRQLQKFQLELTQDCNLEFGLIYQTEETLLELFADNSKYLKYWGTDEAAFRQLLTSFSIPETADLNFYDEYPKVIVPLTNLNPEATPTEAVLQTLDVLLS